MKGFKRVIALIAVLCIAITLLPPMQFIKAAEVTYRYELDTDGIDVGATYLIVNTGSAGTGNALRFYYGSYWSRDFRNQALTVKTEEGVRCIDVGFENEEACQFQFTGAGAGAITHGNYAVNLSDSQFVEGNPSNTLTFTSLGDGQYRIHYTRLWTTYYLQYSNNDWTRSRDSSTVYLYKLTEHLKGYDVTFDGNGYTAGQLPENELLLSAGEEYIIPEPASPLRKDIGEDTWLFLCWNTKPDGSGVEYNPGEKIVISGDITLYADWYQQTKYTISMITDLDGVRTDVKDIAGVDKQFFAKLTGGDGTYIPLKKTETGTYSAKVPDNGDYVIYSRVEGGEYEAVHGHRVTIYNQDGATECQHFSVSYDTQGGTWAEGQDPGTVYYHALEAVTLPENAPTLEGNRFLGWADKNRNVYQPGQQLTASIDKPFPLQALWEETITVTVTVVIDHTAGGGADLEPGRREVDVVLLRQENGVNVPVDEKYLTTDYIPDEENNTTTYVLTYKDMPQGIYRATTTKANYVQTITSTGSTDQDQEVRVDLKYTPEYNNLVFDVVVNAENDGEKKLMPQAVNVRVSYFGHDENNVLGWHIITQQRGDTSPSTVRIDQNGKGSGLFTIWTKRPDNNIPYEFRVEVTSFVMPDGTVVRASGDHVVYTANGSGLYRATVSVENGGRTPTYPENNDLPGAYFQDDKQNGVPTVTVDINPMTVTFIGGDGKVNGENTLVLENQYVYPDLNGYVAVPKEEDKIFICWTDEAENPVANKAGQLLTGNVTYVARYNNNITLSGDVIVDALFEGVPIHEIDRAKKVIVVLQKKVNEVFNDLASVTVDVDYRTNDEGICTEGVGWYEFTDLPNDGTEYRVQVRLLNYTGTYDNNGDGQFTEEEAVAQVDVLKAQAQVDIHLDMKPDAYQQAIQVNASQIHESLRPTGALVQLLYRDLGDVHNYQVIAQHTADPYGVLVDLNTPTASGLGFEDVWNWHTNGTPYETNGTPYEYQAQIYKLYGNQVTGAYDENGTIYTEDSPFTIVYGTPNNYLRQMAQGGAMLEATLMPKQYPVFLDLNLQGDTTPVYGMSDYMVDDGTGNERYVYTHTWSFASEFTAYPYREGWVFGGWKVQTESDNEVIIDNGTVYVGATLAKPVTLVAQWDKLEGTDYSVRYLELNTDKVLKGASTITGAAIGDRVVAAERADTIKGYIYVGAVVGGLYVNKVDNPVMTITDNPLENQMVIYYLPDGSDGYTEQVESNLEIDKTAVLEDDGTYTITMETFTKDNPITTRIEQNTPLDIVLVLDQSGSLAANNYEYLNALQDAVDNFVVTVADHGRKNEVDHRIAIVGYASDKDDGHSSDPVKATGGKQTDSWVNTGVFDSNGEFHLYDVNGFNYTELKDLTKMTADGIYYTKVTKDGKDTYLLLTHHDEYRHLITEDEARMAVLQGQTVFGYVYNEQNVGGFVELTRNSSGLWLYGDKLLYSQKEFFTYHTDVWTHRDGLNPRQIHAYGVGQNYKPADNHQGVYTRTETTSGTYQQSIYQDALIPVSVGAGGSGGTNPGLLKATQSLGADGATRASYGMEMANDILAANPLDDGEKRVRLVVMFTDGDPGFNGFDSSTNAGEAVTEANLAIEQAYIAKHTHNAHVYTIGLYESAGVEAESKVAYYMNALSSNYPDAHTMDDVHKPEGYEEAANGTTLKNDGSFFVRHNNSGSTYYEVKYGYVRVSGRYQYRWYYTRSGTNYSISTETAPQVTNGEVGDYIIYQKTGGYVETEYSGYYATTESSDHLKEYFEDVLQDITTKITTKIELDPDTILRDIMNQGLVLTDDTQITVYTQGGEYDLATGEIRWDVNDQKEPILEEKVSLNVGQAKASGNYSAVDEKSGVAIHVYNLEAANPADPAKPDYHPHTVDITGYNFADWYISETNINGYKMVVTIDRVEAMDSVQWSRSTFTNEEQSGLWLPKDEQGNRQLLLPFDQPTTIFVERAFVLDYGKSFDLSNWYFDDEDGQNATPIHIDGNIADGMNYFATPNTGEDLTYGKVSISSDVVSYSPTTMNWGGYDQFYVFGNTWRRTVKAQDANENGNLWNKVTVIPANNIYFEDSFETDTEKGIEGFEFSGAWSTVYSGGEADKNTEIPEHLESAPYGDVHGWTDALGDDTGFSDGSAHMAFEKGFDPEQGAHAEFTFTGTGVEVYSRTNAASGAVVAVLYRHVKDENGNDKTIIYDMKAKDDLAVSGDYFQVPTISFRKLPYGTYTLQLIATQAISQETGLRHEYYIDGVRIHNPLGNTTNYQSTVVKNAYELETNAVFTEIRDVLLQYKDFNAGLSDSTDGKMGAVFIDWIRQGQGSGNDTPGIKNYTYEIGTYEDLGPKNEVYLKAGQGIVLKVAEGNNYFVGLKSLTGEAVTVNVSGIDLEQEPTAIQIAHSTDMYYRVNPVGGYIVIQNSNKEEGAILAITNLRATNLTKAPVNGGILPVAQQEAVAVISEFSEYMDEKANQTPILPQPEEPEQELPSLEEQAEAKQQLTAVLFEDVRQWLETT